MRTRRKKREKKRLNNLLKLNNVKAMRGKVFLSSLLIRHYMLSCFLSLSFHSFPLAWLILTTSIICISVKPKLSCKGSDSFATGRSSTLYWSSKWCNKRFSCEPAWMPAKKIKEKLISLINKHMRKHKNKKRKL